jgi:hypothetical protein
MRLGISLLMPLRAAFLTRRAISSPLASAFTPSGQLITKQKVGSKPFCPNGFIGAVPDFCYSTFVNLGSTAGNILEIGGRFHPTVGVL